MHVGQFIVILDEANDCYPRVLHNAVSSGLGTAVMGYQGEQQWTQDAALRGAVLREITSEVLFPTCTD